MARKTEQKTGGKKHPGGRPRKYQSVEQLQSAIDSYFESTKKVTVTGLALHLGFNSRQSLINNEGYSEEFLDAIKRAKARVEMYYEEHLVESNAAGSIFALKNFGWRDKQEFDHRVERVGETLTLEEMKKRIREADEAGTGIDYRSIEGSDRKSIAEVENVGAGLDVRSIEGAEIL
jgi:hypothetical protein